MNAKDFRKMAIQKLEIPGFDNESNIVIEVQKPRLLAMAKQGKIPNALMGTATTLLKKGGVDAGKADVKQIAEVAEIYCRACMVNPQFEEVKDVITDEQMNVIMNYAVGLVQSLNSFREKEKNGTNNRDGNDVPDKTKSDDGDRK